VAQPIEALHNFTYQRNEQTNLWGHCRRHRHLVASSEARTQTFIELNPKNMKLITNQAALEASSPTLNVGYRMSR